MDRANDNSVGVGGSATPGSALNSSNHATPLYNNSANSNGLDSQVLF